MQSSSEFIEDVPVLSATRRLKRFSGIKTRVF